MSFVNALALVLCIIGGILTYLCLGPLSGWILIWAIFIATATGVALGGTPEAFKNLIICGIAGVVIAWIGSMIILNVPLAATLTLPVWAGIVVGITTGCLALIANVPLFPAIPATVVGYAMTFAHLLGNPKELLTVANLTGFTYLNPVISISLSIIVAAGFGLVSLRLATMLSSRSTAAAPAPAE